MTQAKETISWRIADNLQLLVEYPPNYCRYQPEPFMLKPNTAVVARLGSSLVVFFENLPTKHDYNRHSREKQ
ncbi:MAG: hypothetical protein DSM106950_04145 [Stigonema ocellatum SAG 48.90 = DSM 106950]|nr:hypothetical protein [Stigonema ocellatum SAG 48.90 = DSM 106950]